MKNILMSLVLLAITMFSMSAMIDLTHAAAPTMFTVNGSTTYEQKRITRIEHTLNFTQQAMPDEWDVTIWPQARFDKYVSETNTPTSIAFTFLGQDHTYINEYFLIWATDEQVQFVLAHEAGHMVCECKSEEKADAIAYAITGRHRPKLERE